VKKLINEVHRRSLWQVLGVYLAGAWIALQVVNEIGDAVGLPEWVSPGALVLLVIGAPIVLATAFINEGVKTKEAEAPRQTLADVGDVPPSPAPAPSGAHKLFTWKRSLLGGVAAFVLLGVITGVWMVMRVTGVGPAGTLVAKGVLDERDRIVLADFGSSAADATLATTVTEALRVDLARAQVVRLADPSQVASALQRMGRPDADVLDEALARELAQREGLKAVLTGDVSPAGSGYVLTASLVAPATGEMLVSERATASDESEVIPAIDELSKRLRERMGESLRMIRAEEPLDEVTTSDLEALRLYTEGANLVEGNDYRRGLDMLEEAIVRDSAFAMAHRKLGVELSNRGENRTRALEAITNAFEYRDRLSPRERYLAEAAYHNEVTDDEERVIAAYQNMLDLDPEDPWALNNLGGIYGSRSDWAEAERHFELANAADSTGGVFSFTNNIMAEANQAKFDEAAETLEHASRLYPGEWLVDRAYFLLPGAQFDFDESERRLAEVRERWTTPFLRELGSGFAAGLAVTRGRLEEAISQARESEQVSIDRGLPGEAIGSALGPAWLDLGARQDPDRAMRTLAAALERHPLEGIPPADRPYIGLARLTALAGRLEESRAWTDRYFEDVPEESRGSGTRFMALAEADRLVQEGRGDEAIELYRRTRQGSCGTCDPLQIARAHLDAGRPDSAVATLTAYVDTPDFFRASDSGSTLGTTYERLANLHDEAGRLEEAARYYAAFVELWADADEDLQPRVRAAQARLEAILGEIG
jgi:tetratricopeptide (TPR) repeat protein